MATVDDIAKELVDATAEERKQLYNQKENIRKKYLRQVTNFLTNIEKGVEVNYFNIYKTIMAIRRDLTGQADITYRYYDTSDDKGKVYEFTEKELENMVTQEKNGDLLLVTSINRIEEALKETNKDKGNLVYSNIKQKHYNNVYKTIVSDQKPKQKKNKEKETGQFLVRSTLLESKNMHLNPSKYSNMFFPPKSKRFNGRGWVYFRKQFNEGNFAEAFDKTITKYINEKKQITDDLIVNYMVKIALVHDNIKGTRAGDTGNVQIKATNARLMSGKTLRATLVDLKKILLQDKKGESNSYYKKIQKQQAKLLKDRLLDPKMKDIDKEAEKIIETLKLDKSKIF